LAYPLSVNAIKVLRLLQNSQYNITNRLKVKPQLLRELEEVMRRYLKYLLERDVKSASWLDALREQMKEVALDS